MNNIFKALCLTSLLFIVACCQHCGVKTNLQEQQQTFNQAILYAQEHLPHQGKLVQQTDGYAYIKVDDDYIHKLFPLLSAHDYKKPPYFRRADAPGAHISVVYEDENVTLKEAGQTFSFTIEQVIVVTPKQGLSYIVLQVTSPSLEDLRKRYGLAPKLKGHEFHITLAKKLTKQSSAKPLSH